MSITQATVTPTLRPGTNVVTLPTQAAAAAQAAVPAPAPAPASPYWPMPQVTPGCCPPGGMSSLMQCYCDIQSATAFITAIMIDAINNNPAVIEAIIAGIEKSGSNLPLLGVTNGSYAQPGQVGEFVDFFAAVPFTTAANQSVTTTMGILQPGDWDIWAVAQYSVPVISGEFFLAPQGVPPPGFSGSLYSFIFTGTADDNAWTNVVSTVEQANISVPTLIALTLNTNQLGAGGFAGTCNTWFKARRRR